MSDDPINLNDHRQKKTPRLVVASLIETPEVFAFAKYEYDDDGIGTIDTGEIIVVLDGEALTGVRMSERDALRLAAAIVQAVATSPYRKDS